MSVQSMEVLRRLLLLFCLTGASQALIPKQCAGNVTKHNAVCCPQHPGNGEVCGGHHLGHCQRIVAPDEQVPTIFHLDDRLGWPTRFFQFACQCHGNFFGIACDECWFGWKGKNCDIKEKRVRKEITTLSDHELHVFKEIIRLSYTWPSGFLVLNEGNNYHSDPVRNPRFEDASVQYFLSFNHRYGSRATLFRNEDDCRRYGILDFNHDGPTFPTWHRYFMLIWERLLGKIAKERFGEEEFNNPYWDSAGLKECNICNNRYIGAEYKRDSYGMRIDPSHPWRSLTEWCVEPENSTTLCYGCQHTGTTGVVTRTWNSNDFPTQIDYDYVLNLKRYYNEDERDSEDCKSFHMALEGFCGRPGTNGSMLWTHNKVHNMIDGSMCCGATAANDPLFLLLHTHADKLFSIWYKKMEPGLKAYPQKQIRPGHCRDCFMVGFLPPVRNSDMFVSEESLGYSYDDYLVGKNAQNGLSPFAY